MPGRNTKNSKGTPKSPAQKRLETEFVPPPGRGGQGPSLENELDKLREKLSGAKDVAGAIQLLGETINHLQTLASRVEDNIIHKVEQQFREQEDDLDDMRQRSMKGNLLLSSTKEHEAAMFPKEEVLEAKGENVMDLARDLVKRKFKVDIPEEDLGTVHYLPKGLIIRFLNQRPGSAWSKLTNAIKSGNKEGDQELPIFANFQLTRKRSTILFHLRVLKREKKIAKFYSDENGAISLRVEEKGPKIKLTMVPVDKAVPDSPRRTYGLREEIMELISHY